MAIPSIYCSDETSICIDPKLLVYESGLGVTEPRYMPKQTLGHESIDLDTSASADEQRLEAYQISSACQDSEFDEEDAEHESVSDAPSPPVDSSLDPEAPVFVPASLLGDDYDIRNEEEPTLEPLLPTKSRPTPRITVSVPNDVPLTSSCPASRGARRNSRTQSRQSSPGRRSPSVSRPRAQRNSRKTSVVPRALAAKLMTALTTAPTSPVAQVPHGFEDRSAPWTSLYTSHPAQLSGQVYPHASLHHPISVGPSIHGYRCSHGGCPESTKVWDTRSDLDHHLRKHVPEDQRARACAQCGRRFHFPKDLRRHLKTHDKMAGVACPICGKFYSRPDNLKRHINTLHKDTRSQEPGKQAFAYSPTPSAATSCTQSPVDGPGHTMPWTLSPLMAKSIPSSNSGHYRHDSVNEPDTGISYSTSESGLFAQPMFKSYSNGI